MKAKVLFVCKERLSNYGYGASFGLLNSCRFVGEALSERFGDKFEFKVVSVADNNKIDREVFLYKPTHVMIEAIWVVPAKMEVLIPRYPKVQWVVRIHSKAPFLSNEGIAFKWINEYGELKNKFDNFNIATNDYSFTEDLEKVLGDNFDYLPNIYMVDKKFNTPHHDKHPDVLDIGCFGAIRPMKNQLEQAIAAIIFADKHGKKLRFHMNGNRTEQKGDQVLENIKALFAANPHHELVLHGWYNHHRFVELVKKMDVGMQVSFSESFNIVAADFVKHDIPVVVSKDITWASSFYQVSATETDAIVSKLDFAYKFRKFNLQYLNKLALAKYNHRAIEDWADYLGF